MPKSFCECHRILDQPAVGWFERLLLRFVPHFDIVKEVEGLCPECTHECDYCDGKNVKRTTLYLRRFYLWRSEWVGKNWGDLYLHKVCRSDDDQDPHDHPWDFTTLVLRGTYRNQTWAGHLRTPFSDEFMTPGTVRRRSADHTHRVLAWPGPIWTLVKTGPYRRDAAGDPDWGFWTTGGRVPWREYLGLTGGEEHGG